MRLFQSEGQSQPAGAIGVQSHTSAGFQCLSHQRFASEELTLPFFTESWLLGFWKLGDVFK